MKPTLENIRKMARREANRAGKPMAILNLNRFSALYVVRSLSACPNIEARPEYVETVNPDEVLTDR